MKENAIKTAVNSHAFALLTKTDKKIALNLGHF
ncbi:unnamed protein product [Commensalibacter communis]|nr:unnamed protein product [Commensalibacter communis]